MNQLNRLLKNFGRMRSTVRPKHHLEKKVLSGKSISTQANCPSILFATIHKAASVYVWEVLKKVTQARKIKPLNFDGHFFHEGHLDHKLDAKLFERRGFLYGPFRKGFGHIGDAQGENSLNFDDYKIIIQLRDPRDALTSSYYSFLHSHCVLPKDRQRIESVRKRMSNLDIDRHVQQHAGFLEKQLTEYMNFFSQSNCLVLHYEDFVEQPKLWSHQIMNFLDVKGNPNIERIFRKMVCETQKPPTAEDVRQHKRKVTPGDYATKLKPRTISSLNHRFADYFQAIKTHAPPATNRAA